MPKKIIDLLQEKKFILSVELVTPRNGEDVNELYEGVKKLQGKIDFVSVTKGAGGSLRGGTLPITYFCQEKLGFNVVSHFVCRERKKQQIENELIDMHYFGISNILALRGDAPVGAKEEAWSGDYKYAYLLIEQIKNMNKGMYLPTPTMKVEKREGLPTNFCILAAGHPENPAEEEIKHMQCKIEAGAEVIMTQMIFSFAEYKNYLENLRSAGINLPVLAGVRPLLNFKPADSVEKFFGLKVADELMNGLKERQEEDEKAKEFGLNYAAEMIKKLKEFGCPGVHLFTLNDLEMAEEILQRIK